jgi:putative Holliday junction resolvase
MSRAMGLDLGDVRTGAAVSDDLMMTAQPAGVWKRKGYKDDLAGVKKLLADYPDIETIVVGRPINMNGTVGERAESAQRIADKLAKELPEMTVVLYDERMTTMAAERTLIEADVSRKKRKEVVDQMAAQLILAGWLDRRRARGE